MVQLAHSAQLELIMQVDPRQAAQHVLMAHILLQVPAHARPAHLPLELRVCQRVALEEHLPLAV